MSPPSRRAVPRFGARVPGAVYVSRPSAYLVRSDGEGGVAVVRTPKGRFLPGGGREAGETPRRAALRELREECGLSAELGEKLGVADELLFSEAEQTHFGKRSHFFRGRAGSAVGPGEEEDHALEWLSLDQAEAQLAHGSHGWAIQAERLAREGGAAI
jgi:8-oxo-dGTP diphosphatase